MTAEELLQRYAAGERDFSGVNLGEIHLSYRDIQGINLLYCFSHDRTKRRFEKLLCFTLAP
jgi:hypothetical protein